MKKLLSDVVPNWQNMLDSEGFIDFKSIDMEILCKPYQKDITLEEYLMKRILSYVMKAED